MKHMKKNYLVLTVFIISMLLSLSACGQIVDNNDSSNSDLNTTEVKTKTENEVNSVDTSEKSDMDKSWEEVKANGELKVGLCAAYPPFESRNEETGEFEGFDIEMIKAIGDKIGISVKIIDAEWPALLGGLNKGDYDVLVTCMSKKEASVENVNMSDVYYNLNNIVVINKNNDKINLLSDLKDKVVGVQMASGSEQIVDAMEGLKEVKRYNYNPEAFLDLENDRIDAVVVGYAYAITQMKENDKYKILEEPASSSEIVMVAKMGANALTDELNKGLSQIKEDKIYSELIEKWLTIK